MPTRKTSHSDQSLEGHRDIAPETLRVWLLGGFQVTVGARRIEQSEWRLKKAIALVKLLALAPGYRLHREQAMEALWPEANRKAASNNLRTTLHATRKILDSIEGSRYLTSQDDSLVLCPQGSVKGGCGTPMVRLTSSVEPGRDVNLAHSTGFVASYPG